MTRKVENYNAFLPEHVEARTPYVNTREKIRHICHIHNTEFTVTGGHFVRGRGCPICSSHKKSQQKEEKYRNTLKKINPNVHLVGTYTNMNIKTKHQCLKCDHVWEPKPANLIHSKSRCPQCSNDEKKLKYRKSNSQYIQDLENVNGDVNPIEQYTGAKTKIKHQCNKCSHVWEVRPNDLLNGNSCPKCSNQQSKIETDLFDFLTEKCPTIQIIRNSRDIIPPQEIDLFIPSKNIGIEIHGNYWHSEIHTDKYYHRNKFKMCQSSGVKLIQIFESEYLSNPDLIRSMILSKMGISQRKVRASNCNIKLVSLHDFKTFITENHVQGFRSSSLRYGLYHKDSNELLCCLSFQKSSNKKYDLELTRWCTKQNVRVYGGFSKIFKHFTRKHPNKKIISYCDKRWSDGKIYDDMGFQKTHETQPNYFYFHKNCPLKLFDRRHFQKSKLSKKLEHFNPSLTEHENMNNNGYYRLFDCGNLSYEYQS